MNATLFTNSCSPKNHCVVPATHAAAQMVDAVEFRTLMVSHRRMVRADRAEELVKGLRDLDTGELFLVEERQLLDR